MTESNIFSVGNSQNHRITECGTSVDHLAQPQNSDDFC